jgi:hypothetical protein
VSAPKLTPYPKWCKFCYLVDPHVPPSERLVILNGYCADAALMPPIIELAHVLKEKCARGLGREPRPLELFSCLMADVHDLVDYLPDPPGLEVFEPVWSVLWNGMGRTISPITGQRKGGDDCEGLATVFVTFARILGYNASCVWWDQPGASLNHVAAQVCDGGTARTDFGSPICIPIETTIPGAIPGETPYDALRRIGSDYQSRVFGGH